MRFLFTLLAVTALSGVAAAQDLERARVAFEQGRVAYEAGDFETALTRFQEAHQITGAPEILYNVATAADRLRRDEVALEAYRGYLAARPGSEDRASVEARIRVLERQIADAQREEEERGAAERAAAEREAAAAAALERAQAQTSDPGPAPWVIAGAGAALAVAGAVLVIVAEVDAGCVTAPNGCADDGPRWEDFAERYDRIPVFRSIGAAALGVGAAAMAAGVIWWVAASGSGPEVALGPGGVRVRGSF